MATLPAVPGASKAGCRILEGGAANETVCAFSLFHYVVAGIVVTLYFCYCQCSTERGAA
jgi:hypothetical protein